MALGGKRGGVVAALLLAGCGGGGETAPPAPLGARLEIAASAGGADALPSGLLQAQAVELRNAGDTPARQVVVAVKPGAEALQLPLACEGPLAARCQSRADGAVEIAELPAGGSVTLRQRLRIQAGHTGMVGNDWSVASADAAVSASLKQSLKAYSFDLGLQHEPVAISGEGAARRLTYTLVLSNAGPDEARDVAWRLDTAFDMPSRGFTCVAGGGAVCPAILGAEMTIARIPKGGSLKLTAEYGGRTVLTDEERTRDGEFLTAAIRAAGDANPANDRVTVQNGRMYPADGNYAAFDQQGRSYRLTINGAYMKPSFLAVGEGKETKGFMAVDVIGSMHLTDSPDYESDFARKGTLQAHGGLLIGAYDLGFGRRPFYAVRDPVRALAELEHRSFTVLGSRSDKDGKPTDAFVHTARFLDGYLSICASDVPVAFDACPAGKLHRYAAALNGGELELLSSTDVVRMRAARMDSGPVLIRADRNVDGRSEFWIALADSERRFSSASLSAMGGLAETTFASAVGLAASVPVYFDDFYLYRDGAIRLELGVGWPNAYLLFFGDQRVGCSMEGTLAPSALPVVWGGVVSATNKDGLCYSGPVSFVQTQELAVLLGTRGGPLMGRWMITME